LEEEEAFKVAVLVFQRLSGNAQTYLVDDCLDRHGNVCCSTVTQPFGDRCFPTAGPCLWTELGKLLAHM